MSLKPTLDTILEVSSQKENAISESRNGNEQSDKETYEPINLEDIPEANEELASSIWKAVQRQADDDQSGRFTPPFPFMEANEPL